VALNLKAITPGLQRATWTWSGHAIVVHEGASFTDGREYPARRWTDVALKNIDPEQRFAELFNETGDLDKAFRRLAEEMSVGFRDAIEAPVYQWPGTTVRRSGEVAGTQRNAVDLGGVRDSQELELG
jgi:hypothetical protein